MKIYLAILFLCFGFSASAQYYQDGSRHNGVNRSMTGQTSGNPKKPKPPGKEEIIDHSVQKLTEDLSLDSFQAAVIKQLLEDNHKEQEIIIAEDIPDESKVEKIVAIREKMNVKIKEILTPEQIEKFSNLGKKKKK